jgi:hypothetical protein
VDTVDGQVVDALAATGLTPERVSARTWSVRVPCEARGTVGVVLTRTERTASLSSFFMRAPDRNHGEVYRRLLRRNHDMRGWRFAVDDPGDVFLLADLPVDGITGEILDDLLGLLVTYVDESFEAVVRAGFDIPPGVRVTGTPPKPGGA